MIDTINNTAEAVFPIQEPIQKSGTVFGYSKVTQFLTWPILFILFHTFFSVNVHGRDNLKKVRSPFIIISNHVSFYDSFIFRLALGFITPHLPLRFMGVRSFNYKFLNFLSSIGVIGLIYKLFGVFTVVPGRGIAQNLKEAKDIIESGGNIVIYPEGRIISNHTIGPFRKGATILARQTGVPVLPFIFHIDKMHFSRDVLDIMIGDPIYLTKTVSDEEGTEILHSAIIELFNKHN